MIKIGINGFGRIGRAILRARFKYPEFNDIEITAINDLSSPEMLAYLLKYDSIFGPLPYVVEVEGPYILVNNKKIRVFQESDPEKIPWEDEGISYVVEATGKFINAEEARKHLNSGVKKVIISAPAKNEDLTVIMGVNEYKYDPSKHHIISNGSCLTNCVAQIINVLKKYYNFNKGIISAVHSYTLSQRLLDAIHPTDFRRARAACLNIIPTEGEALKPLKKVFPDFMFEGFMFRVPSSHGALTNIVLLFEEKTTPYEINQIFKENQSRYLKYEETPLVSTDIIGDTHSAIVDGLLTKVIDGNLVYISAWYDNEWAYAVRILDLIKYMIIKEL